MMPDPYFGWSFMILKLTLASAVAGLLWVLGATAAFAETPTPTSTSSTTLTPTPTKTPTATPLSVPDAAVLRDALLTLAQQDLGAQAAAGFDGVFPVWSQKYPGLGFDGYAVVAKNGRVSTFYNRLNSKEEGSPRNPTLIAFAVGDAGGKCAGAVIYGFPKTQDSALINAPTPCTAQAVVDAFKITFQATPSATATATKPSAPLPPATGQGLANSGSPLPWALALLGGIAAVFAGAGLTVMRKRR